jgi:protein-disulfide isomerase
MKKQFVVFLSVAVVIIALVGLAFYLAAKTPSTSGGTSSGGLPATPAIDTSIKGDAVYSRPYSHMTGSASAPVTLVEFGDYECPVCATAAAPIKVITDKYKLDSNFNYVFRNFPLSQHPDAQITASAAEAAGAQGKYFEMHDLLYANQNDWSGSTDPVSYLVKYGQQLGLDMNKFQSEMTSFKYFTNVEQDMADGTALKIDATPTFYVLDGTNSASNPTPTQYVGVANLAGLGTQINSLMAKADAANPPKNK